jgi:hypothetical protein
MDQGRWERIKDLMEAVVELAPERRLSFLAKVCGDDVALRREVEALLEHHQRADSFLERPLGDMLRREAKASPSGASSAEGQVRAAVPGPSRSTRFPLEG